MMNPFRFKQFEVFDHLSTMKVGTDSVLLGAWCSPPETGIILDVGTGCGILALMMAQRTKARITGIDIDEASIKQASANFHLNPWPERLTALLCSVEAYAEENPQSTDFVISNPPFFINCLKTGKDQRNIARHAESNFHEIYISCLKKILKPGGKVSLILPTAGMDDFFSLLQKNGLSLVRICLVSSRKDRSALRVLIEATNEPVLHKTEETLVCRNRLNRYTDEYKALTEPYYLFLNE